MQKLYTVAIPSGQLWSLLYLKMTVEMPHHWLRSPEQSHLEFHLAHARVKDIFSKLNGAQYFSTLILWADYHHIPLNDDSIPKTAMTFQKIWIPEGSFQTGTSASVLSGIHEQSIEGPAFHHCLPWWHHYQQQICIRTSRPPMTSFSQTPQCKIIHEIKQMPLFHQRNSIFGPCPQHNWYKTPTLKNRSH